MGRKNVTVVQRHRNEGSAVWYARVRDVATGKVRYVSLRTTRRTEAQLLAADMLRDGDFEDSDGARMTLAQGLETYKKYLRTKGTTEESIEVYERIFSRLSAFNGKRIGDIGPDEILETFSRSFSGFSANYYNNARMIVKSMFGFFANVLETISKNPARNIPKRKAQKKEKKFWTVAQIGAILDACGHPGYRLLWAFMGYEGLRVHEALKIRPEDIRGGFLHVVGKGAKYAKIPIGSLMKSELDRAGWKWDFSRLQRRTSSERVAACARKVFGDAYDGEATNHRFRHSFASNLVRAGANILVVQKLMRHASITMTLDTYSHLMDGDLETGIEKLAQK